MSTLDSNDLSLSSLSNSLSDYTPTVEESGLSTTASSSIFNENENAGCMETESEEKCGESEGESDNNEKFHNSKIRISTISLRIQVETAQIDNSSSHLSITSMNGDDISSEEINFINYQSLKSITNDIYDYIQVVANSNDAIKSKKKSKDFFKREKSTHKSKGEGGRKRKKKVKILKAYWKDESEKEEEVALKKVESLNAFDHHGDKLNSEDLEVLENINLLHKLSCHQNLLRIFGYTIDPSNSNHFLVVQYANGGNLRKFLREHYTVLTWNEKLRFCTDLANGLKYIHDHDILHLALHSQNILHHNYKLLISDLGISKSHISAPHLILPYTDPQYLADSANYQQNKQSDVYALGILMHEISSGRIPYDEYLVKSEVAGESRSGGEKDSSISYLPELSPKIVREGYRQQPIFGTPSEYVALYQQCWQMNPTARPSVDEVLTRLGGIEAVGASVRVCDGGEKDVKERSMSEIEERVKGKNDHCCIDIKEINKGYDEKNDQKRDITYVPSVGLNSGTGSGSGLKSVYFSAADVTSYPTDSMIYSLADGWLTIIVVGAAVMFGVFASS
ncbi:6550_t:CDS:2 [Acaulospora colombiana]|uniref:6550_t:CDS:1 n=1 Tax=Acaulospora colombiana TaxID=27376 RepID=A0ACA9JYG8_9GLOM|nr:6550_t:CDS:2 [Acaulospora colombiana]